MPFLFDNISQYLISIILLSNILLLITKPCDSNGHTSANTGKPNHITNRSKQVSR